MQIIEKLLDHDIFILCDVSGIQFILQNIISLFYRAIGRDLNLIIQLNNLVIEILLPVLYDP